MGTIMLCLMDEIMYLVMDVEFFMEVWQKLESLYIKFSHEQVTSEVAIVRA